MLIGGREIDSKDKGIIYVFNPATNEIIDTVPNATQGDIDTAIHFAQEGKKDWALVPQYVRSMMLKKFAEAIKKEKEKIALLITMETGKTIKNAESEVEGIIQIFHGYAEKANHLYGIVLPDSQPGTEKDIVFTKREPLGIVVCIIPHNFPGLVFAHKVAPALAIGNAVIVKPASDSPLSAVYLTQLLLECGVPGNVMQVITGDGSFVGEYLISNSKINAISVTGSTKVGIEIAQKAAKHLHHVFLELGGNDPLIVFEDADIELAVNELIMSRITNAGQICIATKRVLVQNSIKGIFTDLLINRLVTVKVGDPQSRETDMGCLINESSAKEVERQVKLTIGQGARCILGGMRFNRTFFEPTVLIDITPQMDVATDMEIFGPVFPVIGFDTLDEAVEIANSSIYGLMAGVITRDHGQAMKVANRLECGGVVINGSGRYRTAETPFGGFKMSGIGREGVCHTLEEMTQVKYFVMKNILE